MTPERLAIIREHFRRPASASCNTEWALEVCDALAALLPPARPEVLPETPPPLYASPFTPKPEHPVTPVGPPESVPTPPQTPKAKGRK